MRVALRGPALASGSENPNNSRARTRWLLFHIGSQVDLAVLLHLYEAHPVRMSMDFHGDLMPRGGQLERRGNHTHECIINPDFRALGFGKDHGAESFRLRKRTWRVRRPDRCGK